MKPLLKFLDPKCNEIEKPKALWELGEAAFLAALFELDKAAFLTEWEFDVAYRIAEWELAEEARLATCSSEDAKLSWEDEQGQDISDEVD